MGFPKGLTPTNKADFEKQVDDRLNSAIATIDQRVKDDLLRKEIINLLQKDKPE